MTFQDWIGFLFWPKVLLVDESFEVLGSKLQQPNLAGNQLRQRTADYFENEQKIP